MSTLLFIALNMLYDMEMVGYGYTHALHCNSVGMPGYMIHTHANVIEEYCGNCVTSNILESY